MATLTRQTRDHALALALARGSTLSAAAQSAGLSERTAHRRAKDQEFCDRVQVLRDELFARAVGRLAALNVHAVSTLRTLLVAESCQIRLAAAKAVLESGQRLRETAELAKGLADLRRRQAITEKRLASKDDGDDVDSDDDDDDDDDERATPPRYLPLEKKA